MLLPSMLGYLLAVALFLICPWWLMPIAAMLIGIAGNVLFVISHDSAHNSFTPYTWLNALIARICFIPAWHSYTGWIHAHNHVHHGWTNLVPRDYVWAPISKSDYDQLSTLGRAWVRFTRSLPGFAAYYLWDINLRRIFLLQPEVRNPKVRRMWIVDNLLLVACVAGQAWILIQLASKLNPNTSATWIVVWALIVPAIMSNFLIGFTTYLQHTHPLIPWFKNPEEWSFYIGQVRGTTHTHLPYHINSLFHNVMDHTAHHVDPRIPLYNLAPAQQQIEDAYPGDVVQHRFTIRSFQKTLQICQLYDFENHQWLSFSGEPTSSRTISFNWPTS